MARQTEWVAQLNDTLPHYLRTLEVADQPGCFLPCVEGATEVGRQVTLGFSCFAVKIYYTLGLWGELDSSKRDAWIDFLKSFQVDGSASNGQPRARWTGTSRWPSWTVWSRRARP